MTQCVKIGLNHAFSEEEKQEGNHAQSASEGQLHVERLASKQDQKETNDDSKDGGREEDEKDGLPPEIGPQHRRELHVPHP